MFSALESQCQLQNLRASAVAGLPKIAFLQSIISIVEIQIVEGLENFRPKLITNAQILLPVSKKTKSVLKRPGPRRGFSSINGSGLS